MEIRAVAAFTRTWPMGRSATFFAKAATEDRGHAIVVGGL